ncbi:MAG: NUDIX domain-containing protein [Theionarchaea archaeon]|nr:NUDIX domain-containing protein [Theionarchaea archaeon]
MICKRRTMRQEKTIEDTAVREVKEEIGVTRD